LASLENANINLGKFFRQHYPLPLTVCRPEPSGSDNTPAVA
jgi:hypothetical protein